MNTDMEPRDGHPSLLEIVDYHDGDLPEGSRSDVEAHIRACEACSNALSEVGERIGPIEPDLPEPFALPQGVVDAIREDTAPPSDVAPGDLWLLEWGGTSVLGFVMAMADQPRHWMVAPTTVGGPGDGTGQVVVDAESSPIGVELRIWTSLVTPVDQGVFLRHYTSVPHVQELAPAAMEEVPKSWDVVILLAEIGAAMHTLAEAEWLPTQAPSSTSIADRMRAVNVKPSQIAETTGISADVVRDIARGAASPTPAQATALAGVLKVDPPELMSAPELPVELVEAASRPRWRPTIRRRAVQEGVTEGVARLAVATDVVGMAARTTTGERDAATWDALIGQYLHGE